LFYVQWCSKFSFQEIDFVLRNLCAKLADDFLLFRIVNSSVCFGSVDHCSNHQDGLFVGRGLMILRDRRWRLLLRRRASTKHGSENASDQVATGRRLSVLASASSAKDGSQQIPCSAATRLAATTKYAAKNSSQSSAR
jgi:hypothetical protein